MWRINEKYRYPFTANGIGKGPPELQLVFAEKYFQILGEQEILPAVICFYSDGVKLIVDESPVLIKLHALENQGVRLIVCLTCLDYFHLTEKIKVGIIGGMGNILEAQARAEKIISI